MEPKTSETEAKIEAAPPARWQVMPYPEALAALHRAREVFIAASTMREALAGVPDDIGDAVLAFLRCAFDPAAHADAAPPDAELWDIAGALLRKLDDHHVADLLIDVLCRAPDPAIYATLAPGLRGRVPPRVAETAIVMHLRLTDARRRRNAIQLARVLFGYPRYRLTAAGRQALAAATQPGANAELPTLELRPAA